MGVNCRLIRFNQSDHGTFGVFLAPDFRAYSLELPWLDNQRQVSCIPPGHYPMRWIQPRRPKSGMWWLYHVQDVPGRTGILIHVGNYAGQPPPLKADSWGCILLGDKMGVLGEQRAVLNSRFTMNRFHMVMRQREARLEVINAGNTG